MPTRKLKDKNIRKLTKVGKFSYCITIPIEMVKKLDWQERQRIEVSLNGKKITIQDWPKT